MSFSKILNRDEHNREKEASLHDAQRFSRPRGVGYPSTSCSNHATSHGLHFTFSPKTGKMEMAQLVKCLPDEHKDLSSNPQHPRKSWEEGETGRSWEPRCHDERLCLKNNMESERARHQIPISDRHMHMCPCPHTNMYMHTHTSSQLCIPMIK